MAKYSTVNYDDIYSASPINKTAANVVTGNITESEIDEAYHQLDVLNRRLKKADKDLHELSISSGTKYKKYQYLALREPFVKARQIIVSERDELLKKYPFLRKTKKRELQGFMLDIIKERLSNDEWHALVNEAKRNLKDYYTGNC